MPVVHLRLERQRGAPGGSPARLRRHRGGHAGPRPRGRRAAPHAPHLRPSARALRRRRPGHGGAPRHRPPPRPAGGRGRRPGAGRHLARAGPGHARRRRVPQLPRDQEHHLRRGRRAGAGRPRDRAPGRDRAREGHEPRRLLPRGGGQVHLGGGRLELRALGRARRDPRRPARQAREDPGASGGGREALPRGARRLGGRAGRAPRARAAGAGAEPPHLLPPLPGGASARRGAARAAGAGDPGDVPLRAAALGSPRAQARPRRDDAR